MAAAGGKGVSLNRATPPKSHSEKNPRQAVAKKHSVQPDGASRDGLFPRGNSRGAINVL